MTNQSTQTTSDAHTLTSVSVDVSHSNPPLLPERRVALLVSVSVLLRGPPPGPGAAAPPAAPAASPLCSCALAPALLDASADLRVSPCRLSSRTSVCAALSVRCPKTGTHRSSVARKARLTNVQLVASRRR